MQLLSSVYSTGKSGGNDTPLFRANQNPLFLWSIILILCQKMHLKIFGRNWAVNMIFAMLNVKYDREWLSIRLGSGKPLPSLFYKKGM